ncbi:MAG: cyclic nucleotide-binding domain-containing protein [Rubrivivax sp.]
MLSWFFGPRTLADQLKAGRFADALALLDDALQAQPGDPELLERRAQVLARLGRPDEAGAVLVALARRFADRGFGMRAIALLKQAQQLATPPADIERLLHDTAALAHLDDVAASPLFRRFTRDELVAVVQQMQLQSFEPGEILLLQGQPGDSLYLIAGGDVRVFVADPQGRPVQTRTMQAPAFFGEIALLRGGVRTATLTAASPVAVLELTRAGLDAISVQRPHVRQVLVEFAEQREAGA